MDYTNLTESQKEFVDAYVEGAVSAEDAVIACGFCPYEGQTAFEAGQRLLGSKKIQSAIRERMAAHDHGAATALWLLRRFVDYVNVDPTLIYGDHGVMLPFKQWPVDLRRMIRSIKHDELGQVCEVKFEPKTKFYEMIGKHGNIDAFVQDKEPARTVIVVRDLSKAQAVLDERVEEAEAQPVLDGFLELVDADDVELGTSDST